MNDYYENQNPVTRQTLARADAIEAKFDAVEAGFDLLPSLSNLKAGTYLHCSVAGTGNAIELTSADGPASYVTGERITFIVGSANTGAVTINRDGLGVKNFTKSNASAFASGDLIVGALVEAYYDGTRYRQALTDAAASATSAAASAAAAASSASSASGSAGAASSSASSASSSASAASTSASNAATSASNAATSASAASTSASTAATNVANALRAAGNGSAAAPSFSFSSDDDTGPYRVGADELGFAAGGALQASVDTSGLKLASGKTLRNSSGHVIGGNSSEELIAEVTTWIAASQVVFGPYDLTPYGVLRIELDGIQLSGAGGTNFTVALYEDTGTTIMAFVRSTCDTIIGATAAASDRYFANVEFVLMETLVGSRYIVDPHSVTFVGFDSSGPAANRVGASLVTVTPTTTAPGYLAMIIGGGPDFVASTGVVRIFGRRRP